MAFKTLKTIIIEKKKYFYLSRCAYNNLQFMLVLWYLYRYLLYGYCVHKMDFLILIFFYVQHMYVRIKKIIFIKRFCTLTFTVFLLRSKIHTLDLILPKKGSNFKRSWILWCLLLLKKRMVSCNWQGFFFA